MGDGEAANSHREQLDRELDQLQVGLKQRNEANKPPPPPPEVIHHGGRRRKVDLSAAGTAIGTAFGPIGAAIGGIVGSLFSRR